MQGWTNNGGGNHIYPTVRGATNALAGLLSDLCWYGTTHPSSTEWLNNVERIRDALDANEAEYDYDKILTNARRKVTREGGSPKF